MKENPPTGANWVAVFAGRMALGLPVLILAPLYGIWPLDHLISLGLMLPALGAVECLASTGTWLYCPLASEGERHATSYGLPVVQLASLVHRSGLFPLAVSWNITGFLLLYLAGVGTQGFLRSMGIGGFVSLIGSILFLALPIVSAKGGYPLLMWGFALLPMLLWAQFGAWQLKSHIFAFLIFSVALTLGLFQEPYSLVMALTFGGWLAVVRIMADGGSGLRFTIPRTTTWLLACLLAILLYRAYVPGGADYAVMPMDFFRGQGIDLIALVARDPQLFWLGPIFGVGALTPALYFTDGEMTAHSYIGLALVLGVVIFLLTQRFWRDARQIVLLLTFLGASLMALGPSLKINSIADGRSADDPITMQTYLMPPEAAVISLPHQFVYEFPPFRYMRSVSRWYLLAALMLVTLLALSVEALWRRAFWGRGFAVLLVSMALLEHWPNITHRMALTEVFGRLYAEMERDLIGELEGKLAEGETVVFLGGDRLSNEFFSTWLCARVSCNTFNASTDKARKIAMASWPEVMRSRLDRSSSAAERAELLVNGYFDVLVLSHFDLRWDSYSWPPPANRREHMYETWVRPYRGLENVAVDVGEWFSVVRYSPSSLPENDDS